MSKQKLALSTTDKMIAGVCAGLAKHLEIDTTLVHIVMLVAAICGSIGLWVYLILWLVLSQRNS